MGKQRIKYICKHCGRQVKKADIHDYDITKRDGDVQGICNDCYEAQLDLDEIDAGEYYMDIKADIDEGEYCLDVEDENEFDDGYYLDVEDELEGEEDDSDIDEDFESEDEEE